MRKKNIDNYLEKFCFKEKQKYEEVLRSFFVFFFKVAKIVACLYVDGNDPIKTENKD